MAGRDPAQRTTAFLTCPASVRQAREALGARLGEIARTRADRAGFGRLGGGGTSEGVQAETALAARPEADIRDWVRIWGLMISGGPDRDVRAVQVALRRVAQADCARAWRRSQTAR